MHNQSINKSSDLKVLLSKTFKKLYGGLTTMKKMLSLILSLVLMLSFVSISYAAVTIGGNLRLWYQTADDETVSTNSDISTFRFDRLNLTIKADISETSGIDGTIGFFQIGKNSSTNVDIRVLNAYFYQRALFADDDELDFGYFKLPLII
jgi:hypothetical protein